MLSQKVNAIVVLLNIAKMPFKRIVQIWNPTGNVRVPISPQLCQKSMLYFLQSDQWEIVSQRSFNLISYEQGETLFYIYKGPYFIFGWIVHMLCPCLFPFTFMFLI